MSNVKTRVTFYARIGDSPIFNEVDSVEVELTRDPVILTDENRQPTDHVKATSRVNLNLIDALKSLIQKMES